MSDPLLKEQYFERKLKNKKNCRSPSEVYQHNSAVHACMSKGKLTWKLAHN